MKTLKFGVNYDIWKISLFTAKFAKKKLFFDKFRWKSWNLVKTMKFGEIPLFIAKFAQNKDFQQISMKKLKFGQNNDILTNLTFYREIRSKTLIFDQFRWTGWNLVKTMILDKFHLLSRNSLQNTDFRQILMNKLKLGKNYDIWTNFSFYREIRTKTLIFD